MTWAAARALLHATAPFLLESSTRRPRKMERNQTPTRGARLASSISENIIKYFPHHILHQTRMPHKLNDLNKILDTIRKELREKDKIHEKAQKEMRTMQSYSKQAIRSEEH